MKVWKTFRPAQLPATDPQVRPLPAGAVRWVRRLEALQDGGSRTRLVAVDGKGVDVVPLEARPSWLAQVVPLRQVRHRMRLQARPFMVAGGVVGLAAMVDAYSVAPGVMSAGAAAATVAAWAVAPRYLIRESMAEGVLADDRAPRWWRVLAGARIGLGDLRAKSQELVSRRRRLAAYITATAGAWLTLADVTGLDVAGPGGKLTWTLLPALTAVCAWPWLRYVRPRPDEVVPESAEMVSEPGFGQLIAYRWAETIGAVGRPARKAPPAQHGDDPQTLPAVVAGKLPGTVLSDIHRVAGGWAATAVDPWQRGLDWTGDSGQQTGPKRQIAAVFGVGLAAVSLEPDVEDANRCFVMVQKVSPLKETVRWDGPASVNARNGTGMFGRYADGATVHYPVYIPGFGCTHDAVFGTTGSGKSETLQMMMLIDRWMEYRGRGLVADFLIDPQHGQSFGPFVDDLAAPVAASLGEAMLLLEAFTAEGLRRNEYLATVEWVDSKGRKRRGRKSWDPIVDGELLVLNIDEAHLFLSYKVFARMLTEGARMWRKCGMKIRLATHTPLLADLGGSMALRDMLTGGFVWVGRTANALTKGTAFNGQLPVDPRSIPKTPGMAYVLAGENPRALLMRTSWEEDFFDWVRDADDQPIGHPAELSPATLAGLGSEFAAWRQLGELPPAPVAAPVHAPLADQAVVDAVVQALAAADGPLDNRGLDVGLQPHRSRGVPCGLKQVRAALEKLRADGRLADGDGYALVKTPGGAA